MHPDLTGIHVLIVEDDLDSRKMLRRVLLECGANITKVESVGAALEAVERGTLDILVSDNGMPDSNGFEQSSTVAVTAIPLMTFLPSP